jgi:hypothetical protein
MKILSVRRGFASDHSSTSYEFLAVDKKLGKEERAEVSKLSSRVNPTARRADFIYHAEGYDIPGGWENLMERYYDVMYSESYDWWTLALAFNAKPGQYEKLLPYEFADADDLGISISKKGARIIVLISCRIELGWCPDEYGYDEGDEEEDETDAIETGDELLDVLVQVRKQIIAGDYRALYAVWEKYGDEDAENPPPKPKAKKTDEKVVDDFEGMLTRL